MAATAAVAGPSRAGKGRIEPRREQCVSVMPKGVPPPLNTRPRPPEPRGRPATGRIVRLLIGQGHGRILLRNQQEVFFHRSDLCEGTAFNDLRVGDAVTFDLLEDTVSGARAVRVARRAR